MRIPAVFLFLIFSINFIPANEPNLLDIDINNLESIFNEPAAEIPEQQENNTQIISNIRKRGIDINASYEFQGAINPGWDVYPWELNGSENFSWALGVLMRSTLDINAQISEALRVKSVFKVEIPYETKGILFTLGDFFFDYNFFDRVFLRAGKYELGWGVSPNFGFTNLLSRIAFQQDPPAPSSDGPSYIIKFDVPAGIGGIQLLAQTRVRIIDGQVPTRDFIGFGGKINLAFRWADFNFGVYYQNFMATRGILSVKTSIWDTDFYSEGLVAYNNHSDNTFNFAFNLGFSKGLFNNKLDINGELFYNSEGSTYYFSPETNFHKEQTSPFPEGFNAALNILFRADEFWNMRIFTRFRYGEESFSIIPGLRITPLPNIEVYLAVPIALGSKNGIYYTESKNIQGDHRPFSIVLYVSIKGSVQASQYY